jgi:hypothetical protein
MPTYNLLGFQVWIPDFSDLVRAVTEPLQEHVSRILTGVSGVVWPLLQNLAGQIAYLLHQVVDPVWNLLSRVAADISGLPWAIFSFISGSIQNLIWPLSSLFNTATDNLWSRIRSLLDELWSRLLEAGRIILEMARPWYDSIIAFIKGDISPLLSQILGTASSAATLLGNAIPQLQGSMQRLSTQLDALRAQIQGQPIEWKKIFSATVNEVLNPLATLAKDIWTSFVNLVKPIAESVSGLISGALTALLDPLVSLFYGIGGAAGEVWPQGSLSRALGGMIQGMVAFNAAYVGITTLELIHPLKQIGLLRIIDATRSLLGADTLGRLIAGVTFSALYTTPLRYEMQALYRPNIPDTRHADQMLFEGHITEREWRDIYAYHGWKERHIDAWYQTMFIEPSDRMIVGMIEGGEVNVDWLQRKLIERGYTPEDAAMILRYGTRKALDDEIKATISEIQAALLQGQMDLLDAREELQALGITGKELEYRLRAMEKRIRRKDIEETINILTTQAKNEELTIEAYRSALIALGLRMPRVNALVAKEEARRRPKTEAPKEKRRDLAAGTYQRLFIEDVIPTEDLLRRYLSELTPPLAADRIELLILDAKIRKAKTAEEKVKPEVTEVREVERYKGWIIYEHPEAYQMMPAGRWTSLYIAYKPRHTILQGVDISDVKADIDEAER